jgi:hypothetical protein
VKIKPLEPVTVPAVAFFQISGFLGLRQKPSKNKPRKTKPRSETWDLSAPGYNAQNYARSEIDFCQ